MTFQTLKPSHDAFKTKSLSRYYKATLLAFAGVIAFSVNAWSHDQYDFSSYNQSLTPKVERLQKVSPSAVNNSCKSLLKTNQTFPTQALTVRNQRSAGKVAALGMILGARFALEPKDTTIVKASLDEPAPINHQKTVTRKDRSALAIAAYRQCQKEQALEQLALAN